MEVSKDVCAVRTHHYDVTLEQHEQTIKQLTECTQKLTVLISAQEEKQKDLDKRLKNIEKKPSDYFEKLIVAGLTAIATILVTILFKGV